MRGISKYFYLTLSICFIISAISLLLGWLGGEDNVFGNFFSAVSFYMALIGLFLVFIYIIILTLSFIQKYSKYIFLLLQYSFILSAVSLLLAWLGGEDSRIGSFFSGISFYGTLISVFLFGIHLVGLILSFILKNNSKT